MNSVLSFLPDNFQRFSQLYGREDLACNRQHPSPVLKAQHVGKQHQQVKRRRTDSIDSSPKVQKQALSGPIVVKADTTLPAAPAMTQVAPNTIPPVAMPTSVHETGQLLPSESAKPAAQLAGQSLARSETALSSDHVMEVKASNRAVDRIEAHLNLQILLKHEELRLIETEMAKCQISLEQLRRVHAIPYPDSSASHERVYNAATSSTPALAPQPGHTRPQNPAPMGVTDGPYTRHYARWLLPDDTFDPAPPRLPRGSSSSQPALGRKRPALDEIETPKPKRASTSMFQQLPVANGTSKSLIVQRPGGKWVRIICKLCGKDDSANLQGFTNHTRIKHSIIYPTHLDAMNDCGHELNEEEAAQADAVMGSMVQQQPQLSGAVPTPVSATGPLVHPLITGPSRQSASAISLQYNLADKPRKRKRKADSPPSSHPTPNAQIPQSQSRQAGPSTQFIPYLGTPSLSKLLEKRGSTLNLQSLGTSAKRRIDLDEVESIPADDESQYSPAPNPSSRPISLPFGSSRMPARAQVPAPVETELAKFCTDSPMDTPMQEHSPTGLASHVSQRAAPVPSPVFADNVDPTIAQSSLSSPAADATAATNPGMVPDDEGEDDDHSSCVNHSDRDDASTTSAQFHVQDEQDHTHSGAHNSYVFHSYEPDKLHKGLAGANAQPHAGSSLATTGFFNPRTAAAAPVSGPTETTPTPPKKKRGRPRKNAP